MVRGGAMLDIVIDTGTFDALRRGWSPASHKSMATAFKMEAFRLRGVTKKEFERGMGPQRSPLAKAQARGPGWGALTAFSRFVSYRVTDKDFSIEAKIGFGRQVDRARNPSGRRTQLETLFGGTTRTITRADQSRIARKLRRRMGEPVRKERRKGPRRQWKNKRKNTGFLVNWADLGKMIPREGSRTVWPKRDFAAFVVGKEHDNSVHNITHLYAAKLRGEGIKRGWWDTGGRF